MLHVEEVAICVAGTIGVILPQGENLKVGWAFMRLAPPMAPPQTCSKTLLASSTINMLKDPDGRQHQLKA